MTEILVLLAICSVIDRSVVNNRSLVIEALFAKGQFDGTIKLITNEIVFEPCLG